MIREGINGTVIVRTGRRIPGVTPIGGIHHPITVCRMAVGDAYGAEQWREPSDGDELAFRIERISRRVCRAVAEHAFRIAAPPRTTAPPRLRRAEVDGQPGLRGNAEGGDGRGRRAHAEGAYEPVLIDATYAGLVGGAATGPLVIPTLNRDGDLLSDLVMPMFGSIAGAESILLSLDDDLRPAVAMAEAPHGTAPSLAGKDIANPMAMILACAAVLHYAAECGVGSAEPASRAVYDATLGAAGDGIRTHDLGGEASTSEVCVEVVRRVRVRSVAALGSIPGSGGRSGSRRVPARHRTYVRVECDRAPVTIGSVLIPRFSLLAAVGGRREMLTEPIALAPEPGREQAVGEASGAAEAFGIRAGMPVSEALGRCPRLILQPPDPGRAASGWERILRRLESIGAEVESSRSGEAFFAVDGLRGIWGPRREDVLARAGRAIGTPARIAGAPNRFCARAAATMARGARQAGDPDRRAGQRAGLPGAAADRRCSTGRCATGPAATTSGWDGWSRRWSGSASRPSGTSPGFRGSRSPTASAPSACRRTSSPAGSTRRSAPAPPTRTSSRRSDCPRPPTEPSSSARSTC